MLTHWLFFAFLLEFSFFLHIKALVNKFTWWQRGGPQPCTSRCGSWYQPYWFLLKVKWIINMKSNKRMLDLKDISTGQHVNVVLVDDLLDLLGGQTRVAEHTDLSNNKQQHSRFLSLHTWLVMWDQSFLDPSSFKCWTRRWRIVMMRSAMPLTSLRLTIND